MDLYLFCIKGPNANEYCVEVHLNWQNSERNDVIIEGLKNEKRQKGLS